MVEPKLGFEPEVASTVLEAVDLATAAKIMMEPKLVFVREVASTVLEAVDLATAAAPEL